MPKNTNIKLEERILVYIKRKDAVNLEELLKFDSRQSVMYNLRNLHEKGLISSYVKMNDSLKNKQVKIRDDEIFFKFVKKYQTPHEIMALIDEMCGDDKRLSSLAHDDFIKLYSEKHSLLDISFLGDEPDQKTIDIIKKMDIEQAQKIALTSMSKRNPKLKEAVTLDLLAEETDTFEQFSSRKHELEVEPEEVYF